MKTGQKVKKIFNFLQFSNVRNFSKIFKNLNNFQTFKNWSKSQENFEFFEKFSNFRNFWKILNNFNKFEIFSDEFFKYIFRHFLYTLTLYFVDNTAQDTNNPDIDRTRLDIKGIMR